MEFRCKLSEVDELEWWLRKAVKEPLRTYEVHPTEESLGWGRSMVCEFDYTVHIPALKLFFRDAVEFEFDEEEQEDMPIEGILHYYHEVMQSQKAVFILTYVTMYCGISKMKIPALKPLTIWSV